MEASISLDKHRDYASWNAQRWSDAVPDVPPDAALAAVRYMAVAERLAASQLESLRPWKHRGIANVDDFRTLALIRLADPNRTRVGDIAQALNASPGTISNRVDRLERHGWVLRTADHTDRRSSPVSIGEDIAHDVDNMYRALVDQHRTFFAPLGLDDSNSLNRMLALLLPAIADPHLTMT